ncbi:hypothetical protein ACERII_16870 [Evansella sp. AB-rgal1]|uniref:hypothetical protein n=1 Tax=Evansella sp. AB-rgal1 TaxID=3242696 RepID=UPI00359D521D
MLRFLLNFSALVFVIFINSLYNALPFNGQTTSEIANRLNVLFTYLHQLDMKRLILHAVKF